MVGVSLGIWWLAAGSSTQPGAFGDFTGFVVTGAVVWGSYTQLPDTYLATRVARGDALFLAFLGISLELPLVGLALYKGEVPAAVAVKRPRRSRETGA